MYNLTLIEEHIIKIIKRFGLSKNKLLFNTELNKSVFDNMKKRQIPSIDKIHKISDYIDCSMDYLVGKTDCSVPWEVLEAFYQKISDKADNILFEKEIIRFPTTLTSDYVIKENDYSKYIDVYDIAYKYAPDKVANIISKGDYISQIKKHSDIIDKLVGNYTMNQNSYNKFHEVYKIYCETFISSNQYMDIDL